MSTTTEVFLKAVAFGAFIALFLWWLMPWASALLPIAVFGVVTPFIYVGVAAGTALRRSLKATDKPR